MRGVAVAAVLLFHQGFGWAKGGFLGVSTFFTLSGFLICTLLVDEHRRRGAVRLGRFWIRRARRLLPASALTIAGILVYTALFVPGREHPNVVGDIRAALAFVANWRLIATQHTYAGITADPSPVQHYWSLGIEEQFYLVFPLLVALCLRWRRAVLATALAVLAGGSLVLQMVVQDPTRTYFGTDTRALELLVGTLLALWWARPSLAGRAPVSGRVADAAGVVGLVGTLALFGLVGESDRWLYHGGFALTAAASTALLIGALRGPVTTRVLGARPLVHLGRISYGVYLYHWPVFLTLSEARTGLGGWPLFLVRLAVTLAIAEASFWLIEWPIRRGGIVRGIEGPLAIAIAACVLLAFTVPVGKLPTYHLASASGGPLRVLVIGDSTAAVIGPEVEKYGRDSGRLVAQTAAKVGCGFIPEAQVRYRLGFEETRHCSQALPNAMKAARAFQPNVILLIIGYPDMADLRLPGQTQWHHMGEPVIDNAYLQAARSGLALITALGVPVVWLDTPDADWDPDRTTAGVKLAGSGPVSLNHPARAHRINQLDAELVKSFPLVRIAPFAAQLGKDGTDAPTFDPTVRFDGMHMAPAKALALAQGWLGDQLLQAYEEHKGTSG